MAPYLALIREDAPQRERRTPADEQERVHGGHLTQAVQEVTGGSVEVASVDQGDSGSEPQEGAESHGIERGVVKLPDAKRGFVLLSRRWTVPRLTLPVPPG